MRLGYLLDRAFSAMRTSPLIQLSAIGAMTVSLILAGMAALGALNMERLTAHWGRGTHLIVYLQVDASPARVDTLQRVLEQRPEVASVRLVSSEQAFDRLKQTLGARGSLLEGVDQDFMPPSLELRLAGNADRAATPLLALLESLPGVQDVDYLGQWADRLGALAAAIRGGALLVALLVALACLYIAASTVRLGIFARRDEIDIQRLLGATDRFIRAPFLVEGAAQGLLSATVALATLYGLYAWLAPRLEPALQTLMSRADLAFFTPLQLATGFVAAALVGLTGSRLALSRYGD